jgi:hypothetical protein
MFDQLSAEALRSVARPVVSQHPLDGDAIGGEEGPGPAPEADGGHGLLVGMDVRIGQARVGVDGGVDVGVADTISVPTILI